MSTKNLFSQVFSQIITPTIISSISSGGLLLSVASDNAITPASHINNTLAISTTTEFKQIQQPLWLKGIVTASGLGLISLEIWWFILSKPKS